MSESETKSAYLSCDFSGIQDYVLGIRGAGAAQAKRLRARSFLLELFEYAALDAAKRRMGADDSAVLTRGGGGFTIELNADADAQAADALAQDLQRMAWDETGGKVHVSLALGDSPDDARARLERRKRRPAQAAMQDANGAWRADALSLPPLGDPCAVCGQSAGRHRVQDDDDPDGVLHCGACLKARELGERLTRWDWMRVGDDDGDNSDGGGDGEGGESYETARALGATFRSADANSPGAFRTGRWIPRAENGREPLTFAEISERAAGDNRLAALKADVDDMGIRVGKIAADGGSSRLREFSRDLHVFFAETVQDMLAESWRSVYTIYAGGDDLLLIAPWDAALDFAGALADAFEKGPGSEYAPITLSAGVALFPYRMPVRHAVDRAEKLLDLAKDQDGKNSCAALESVWSWGNHDLVIGDGKRLAGWARGGFGASRSLYQRLLRLTQSAEPTRAARWTYQVERNVRRDNRSGARFRGWARNAALSLETDPRRTAEIAASLRYALLATRAKGE